MKKLMFVAVAALCGSVMADGIASDTVGYVSKASQQGKFYIYGSGFSATDGSHDINAIISGFPGTDYDAEGAFETTAAQIQIPSGAGYAPYYYLNNAWDIEEQKEVAGWADSMGNLVHVDVLPGVAFWAKSVPAAANLNTAGTVNGASSIECPTSFAIRANALPLTTKLNGGKISSSDIKGVDYDAEGAFETTACQIQLMQGAGYAPYYYLNNAWDIENQKEVEGWADSMGNLVDVNVVAGDGFWTKGTAGAFTLDFAE